jgi:hypothetical protein
MSFERKLEGHIYSDNAFGAHKISLFVQLITVAASGLSWLLLLAVEMKSLVQRDSSQNHHTELCGMMARSVLFNI